MNKIVGILGFTMYGFNIVNMQHFSYDKTTALILMLFSSWLTISSIFEEIRKNKNELLTNPDKLCNKQ